MPSHRHLMGNKQSEAIELKHLSAEQSLKVICAESIVIKAHSKKWVNARSPGMFKLNLTDVDIKFVPVLYENVSIYINQHYTTDTRVYVAALGDSDVIINDGSKLGTVYFTPKRAPIIIK